MREEIGERECASRVLSRIVEVLFRSFKFQFPVPESLSESEQLELRRGEQTTSAPLRMRISPKVF